MIGLSSRCFLRWNSLRAWVLIVAIALTACQSNATPAETFTSEAGEFSIATPAPLEQTQQSVETPVGPVEIYTFTAEADETAYVVAYSDYPLEMVREIDPQELLDSSRDGAVANLGGTLETEEAIDLDGNPGRSLVISTEANQAQPATINSRIYLVDNRLYQILVVTPEGTDATESSAAFLDSFNLE
ncbi:MAG: hypothetical protein AAF892_02900 [Cyanobacteria bacterium P01_D01_bin.71]